MTRPLEAKVYEADGTTLVGTLTSDNARGFLVDIEGRGAFSFESHAEQTGDLAMLTPGRLVRFFVHGTARYTGKIGPRKVVLSSPDRAPGRTVNITGNDWTERLGRAAVYPELGVNVRSPKTRYFNPASFDFDASSWPAATELKQQDDPATPWSGAPKNYPDPLAKWIGAAGDDVPGVAPGYRWVVKEFTLADAAEVRFFLTADDGFVPYLDGDRRPAEQGVGLWNATRYFDAKLDAGTHRLAARVVNFPRPDPTLNVAGFILSGIELLDGGDTLGAVFVRTDSTWKLLADPASEPGMTPGKILEVLVDEAQARGTLPGLSLSFDADLDSNGDPWPGEIDFAFPVMQSLLELTAKLAAEGVVEIELDAGSSTLHAWPSRGTDLSGTVSVSVAVDIADLEETTTGPGKNVVLAETSEERFVETVDAAAVALYGRDEVGLSLGAAPSDEAGDRQALAYLAANALPKEAFGDVAVEITPTSPVPFVDYSVGDEVTIAGAGRRVLAIGVRTDNAGNVRYSLDVGDKILRSPEQRLARAIAAMNPGSGGGNFDAVAPSSADGTLETWGDPTDAGGGTASGEVLSWTSFGYVIAPASSGVAEALIGGESVRVVFNLTAAVTGATTIEVHVNGTSIGSVTITSGTTRAEATFTSTVAAGDLLEIYGSAVGTGNTVGTVQVEIS